MRYNNDRMGVHGPSWLASICYAVWLGVTLLSSAATAQVSVAAWHNDLSRTGANTKETTLIVSNVNQNTFGKLFSMPVDGLIFVQPLYLPNLNIAGKVRNVLFVATAANSLYAFDALSEAQLWRKNFGTPPDAADLSTSTDIVGPVGIIGTPVIDPATDTLYLVDRTKNTDGSLHQILRAVDVISGSDKLGSPQEITATFAGFTFNPQFKINVQPWPLPTDLCILLGLLMETTATTTAGSWAMTPRI